MSTPEALKRARRGAAFLDKKLGRGWRRRIKRRKLDMAVGYVGERGCILAQLSPDGEYLGGLKMVDLYEDESGKDMSLGFDLGFDRGKGVEYDELTDAWLEVLRS